MQCKIPTCGLYGWFCPRHRNWKRRSFKKWGKR